MSKKAPTDPESRVPPNQRLPLSPHFPLLCLLVLIDKSLVAQASLELAILQYHTLKCWDYQDAQSCLGNPAISNPEGFSIAWPTMMHLRSGTQPHPNIV